MAKYTMELREIVSTFGEEEVESWFSDYELSDYLTPEEIAVINDRGVWTKQQLAKRIVRHFYLREICTDAIGSFQLFVRDTMAELMESYAPLIYSASIHYDPLVNVNFTESFDRTTNDRSDSQSNGTSSGLTVSSDTPQGNISKSNILSGAYASATGASENENLVNDSSTNNGKEHYERTTVGNSGVSATAQKMIQLYRDNIRAIDTEIMYKCEPLFIGLY